MAARPTRHMRVWEIARKTGLTSREVLAKLRALRVPVTNHSSNVSPTAAKKLIDSLHSGNGAGRVERLRVYELARDSGLSNDEVIRRLRNLDIRVSSHASTVSIQEAQLLDEELGIASAPTEPEPSPPQPEAEPPRRSEPRRLKHYFSLMGYVKGHRKTLAIVLITLLTLIGFELLRPWPMKVLVDQVLSPKADLTRAGWFLELLPGPLTQQWLLFWVVIGGVVAFLGVTLLSMVYTMAAVGMGQRMTYNLASDLFLHMQRLSLQFHNKRTVGDSIHRVTLDPYCLQSLVNGALLPMVHAVVTLGSMFFIMWRLNARLTLVSLVVVPFVVYTIRKFRNPMRERSRARYDLEGNLMSIVEQTLSAMPAVQAFNREKREHARFRQYADKTVRAYLRSTSTDLLFKLFMGLVTVVGTALITWLGAVDVLHGRMSLGILLVFLSYLGLLYGPIGSITEMASTLQHAAAGADRVMEILESTPDVHDSPDSKARRIRGQVRYRNVSFAYEPGRPVLRGVDAQVGPGKTLAIVGTTGAGKSTLVNLLVRFFDPDSGTVEIDGRDVKTIKLRSLRKQVALVLQEPFIFPATIAENIAYGRPGAPRGEIVAAAQEANAHEFILRLPNGYDTEVGERGATLSGGEKQRLSIARAFLKDAPILILDEPTSALDGRTESALLDALRRLMRGRVTLIIAHRLSTIRNADQIIVLERGMVVERGTHSRLLQKDGAYASLYRHQTRRSRAKAPRLSPKLVRHDHRVAQRRSRAAKKTPATR